MNRTGTIVAATLGGVLVIAVISIAVLAGYDKPTPGVLENLASGALGALAALLARVGADDVRVVNPPDQPVPVEPGDPGHADVNMLVGLLVVVVLIILLFKLVGAL